MKKYFLFFLILFFSSCSIFKLSISNFKVGSDLNLETGKIKNYSTEYTFKKFTEGKLYKNLFDYLYFQGDTFCLSFKTNHHVDRDKIKIFIRQKNSNLKFRAERIEVSEKKIFAFSLIGSLMENFYKDNLSQKLPKGNFCCKKIPIIINIQLFNAAKKIALNKEYESFFIIKYK